MNKLGLATIAASALTAAILGLAAPAQAATINDAPTGSVSATTIATGIDHQTWVNDNHAQQQAQAPKVDTSVQHHP